jgi:hypothetical protein
MDILCNGNLHNLAVLMNGLAALSNLGLFTALIKVSALAGVVLMGLEVISCQSSGGWGIPWGRFIVVFIVFAFLFGHTVTVHLQDPRANRSLTVQGVPYGAAFTGNVIFKVAHQITMDLEMPFQQENHAKAV